MTSNLGSPLAFSLFLHFSTKLLKRPHQTFSRKFHTLYFFSGAWAGEYTWCPVWVHHRCLHLHPRGLSPSWSEDNFDQELETKPADTWVTAAHRHNHFLWAKDIQTSSKSLKQNNKYEQVNLITSNVIVNMRVLSLYFTGHLSDEC